MEVLLFLLLPVAAISGWFSGRKCLRKSSSKFTAHNYLLSQNPDKTLEALVHMPSIDDDTVESHLTLGTIFRRRGEIERAIRLHQGLLERPHLDEPHKSLAYLELARDYLAVGMLDRAESILLELVANKKQVIPSLQHLLELYQQGKEWEAAINMAKSLQKRKKIDLSSTIAHFHCELAEQRIKEKEWLDAKKYLQTAKKIVTDCPRAIILLGNIEQETGNYEQAIKLYKHVASSNIDYLQVVINDIIACYQQSSTNSTVFNQQIKKNTKFVCENCGFLSSKLQWHCPSCKQWDMSKPKEYGSI